MRVSESGSLVSLTSWWRMDEAGWRQVVEAGWWKHDTDLARMMLLSMSS